MYTIDLSLAHQRLYSGCSIEEVAGRLNLTTPPEEAVQYIGRNLHFILSEIPSGGRQEVTLTGPMAVWAYLVVFHVVAHRFRRVYYDDGRNGPLLVAAHG